MRQVYMIEKFRKRQQIGKSMVDLDVLLIQALFAPAVKAGIFDSADFSWMYPNCENAEDAFIKDLPALSEYYQGVNPVLSAAIWAIWDTLNTMESAGSGFGWISVLLLWLAKSERSSRRRSERRFVLSRTIVATAAIKFSDSNVPTAIVPHPMDNYQKYKEQVEVAIRNLSSKNQFEIR
jgi:hypothetical protein